MPPLSTIGYEGTTIDRVVTALIQAGIGHLIDVRAVASSRKPGFSKRQLQASVEQAGLRYTHLRGLGTPKAGRDAVRKGDVATMRRIFAAHMQTPEAVTELARAAAIASEFPTCLLCFERDHDHCHRSLIAERLGGPITHLRADLP